MPEFIATGRTPQDKSRVLRWKNDSGEEIPAFACVKLDSYDGATDLYSAKKPDGTGHLYVANGPVPVASLAYGESHLWARSQLALTDGVFNDSVGPTSGSWEFTIGGTGWTVFSDPASGVAAILPTITQDKRVAVIDSLAAPSSVIGTPTTCVCAVLAYNSSTGMLEVTDERITATNFTKSLTAVDGTYGLIRYIGVWEIYWVDCEPDTALEGLDPEPTPEEGGP